MSAANYIITTLKSPEVGSDPINLTPLKMLYYFVWMGKSLIDRYSLGSL